MRALLEVILMALQLYVYLIVASAILSWLVAFNVVNTRNNVVRSIWNFLDAVTEPALRPIRRILPNLGGVDISPVISHPRDHLHPEVDPGLPPAGRVLGRPHAVAAPELMDAEIGPGP